MVERILGKLFEAFQPAMPAIGEAIGRKIIGGPIAPMPPSLAGGAPAPPSVPPGQPASEATGSTSPVNAAPADPQEAVLAGMLRQVAPLALNALGQGADGYGFAESLVTLHGRLAYDQLAGSGPERIMALAKADPGLWPHLAPLEAKFTEFVREFCRYDEWTEEQEHQDQDEEPPRAHHAARQ